MSATIPWDEIPDSVVVSEGMKTWDIESLEETETSTGKLMVKATLKVDEPADEAGMTHYENYVLGTEDDPMAEDPVTWRKAFGAISFKKLCGKAGIQQRPTLEATCHEGAGHKFMSAVTHQIESREGPYKGNLRVKLGRYYAVGEQEMPAGGSHNKPAAALPKATNGATAAAPPKRTPPKAPVAAQATAASGTDLGGGFELVEE